MKIVLASEVFPPKAGGAGWSTRALALALAEAGHEVHVVTTADGPANDRGVPVIRVPGVEGRFRRGAMTEIFRSTLEHEARDVDVVHAQHALSALGVLALEGRRRTVVTVRDHWPVCFWSTRISQGALCPRCSTSGMWRCIDRRLPRLSAPVAIPYMKHDLGLKQRTLARADGVIAVSEAIATELRAVSVSRVQVIPNIVDAQEVNAIAAEASTIPLPARFLLFVGKLEANKGALDLIPSVALSKANLPLVVLGSGSGRDAILGEAERRGIEVILPGWTERGDVLRAMKRAEALVFPSTWPEPLSRVLLEALALGTPIAAVDTGGTSELIEDGKSGLLARTVEELGASIARIVHDASVRSRLAEGAVERSALFSPSALIPRYEAIYRGGHA